MRVVVFYHRSVGEGLQFDPISLPDAQLGLHAAASLARLLHGQSRPGDVPAFPDPVYDGFSEGVETGDLKSAKTLLDALGHAQ
jgi:predicted ATPase